MWVQEPFNPVTNCSEDVKVHSCNYCMCNNTVFVFRNPCFCSYWPSFTLNDYSNQSLFQWTWCTPDVRQPVQLPFKDHRLDDEFHFQKSDGEQENKVDRDSAGKNRLCDCDPVCVTSVYPPCGRKLEWTRAGNENSIKDGCSSRILHTLIPLICDLGKHLADEFMGSINSFRSTLSQFYKLRSFYSDRRIIHNMVIG